MRTRHARKVLIVNGFHGLFHSAVPEMEPALRSLGYRPGPRMRASHFRVTVWISNPDASSA